MPLTPSSVAAALPLDEGGDLVDGVPLGGDVDRGGIDLPSDLLLNPDEQMEQVQRVEACRRDQRGIPLHRPTGALIPARDGRS